MEHGLNNKRCARRQRQQNAGRENKEQHSCEERHHRVKHDYTYGIEIIVSIPGPKRLEKILE